MTWRKREGEAAGHQSRDADKCLELTEILFPQLHGDFRGTAHGARGRRGRQVWVKQGLGADPDEEGV